MLSIILDIVGAYLIARNIKRRWLAILAAIGVGIGSSIMAGLLISAMAGDVVAPAEVALTMLVGFFWHPLIVLLALYFFRRSERKKARAGHGHQTS